MVFIAVAWALKAVAWRCNDTRAPVATAASAIGLPGGAVRTVEWPHTSENYVQKEMGYRVARKHAARLRRFVHGLAFAMPLACVLVMLSSYGVAAMAAGVAAVVFMIPGMLIERWLFFAEARHTASLYY
jgi:DMSO reductase anchor subunit